MPKLVRPINLKKPVVNRKLIAWGFIVTGMVSIASWWAGNKENGIKNTLTSTSATVLPTPIGQATMALLQPQIATASGSYGIYVYNLVDRSGYGINSEAVFPAASIMKVPIMVAAYRQVESGKLSLSRIESLLEAMGKRSDNDAPVTLINLIGRPFIHQTLTDLGMTNSDFDQNTTTAYDVAIMWKTLYDGRLISSAHWEQMQKFLTDSIFEERIPAGVPQEIAVVHKVGTDFDVWADAGIIMADRPLTVVVLNDGVILEEAKLVVPRLVEAIWKAETGRQ